MNPYRSPAQKIDPDQAACVGQFKLFDSRDPIDHRRAAELCKACPMSAACAAIVVDIANDTTGKYGPVQGTWAGRGYGLRQRGEPVCGRESGAMNHRRRQEPNCEPCRAFLAEKGRKARERRKERANAA